MYAGCRRVENTDYAVPGRQQQGQQQRQLKGFGGIQQSPYLRLSAFTFCQPIDKHVRL